ncbi:hypothetical protein HK099_005057 [Clydaea vesicula]|uniref:Alanine racemase N-terminal domain-containing protein n=1 Tax=Clydaea vesicula TaxID=447962 RepID=A0AAD5U7Y1_9FUNG|nr:hypothetical protein HK099_005057 [Clydaea vesicula]
MTTMLRSEELKINLEEIKKKIPNNVRLVAVSKTKPIEDILSIYNCGQRHFGENVQELVEKAEVLPKDINWHFIGTLQSNKAKALAAVPNLFLVETLGFLLIFSVVDISFTGSVKAANSLNKACEIRKEKLKVYIQVNTSGEESKSGINPNDAVQFAKHVITECHFLDLAGLMTIGFANPDLPNMKNPDFEVFFSFGTI